MVLCVASVFLLITFVLVFVCTPTHTHILKTKMFMNHEINPLEKGVVYQQIILIWIKYEKNQ